jgi:hypothetical protein
MLEVNDKIRVATIFGNGKVDPVWFEWKGRKIRIEKISYRWKEKEGSCVYMHYSIISNGTLYHIIWDRERMEWYLKEIGDDVL